VGLGRREIKQVNLFLSHGTPAEGLPQKLSCPAGSYSPCSPGDRILAEESEGTRSTLLSFEFEASRSTDEGTETATLRLHSAGNLSYPGGAISRSNR